VFPLSMELITPPLSKPQQGQIARRTAFAQAIDADDAIGPCPASTSTTPAGGNCRPSCVR
jgi:hypothetical protein